MYKQLNIHFNEKVSNNTLINTELVYYTHWKNKYHFNLYERLELLTIYLLKCEEAYWFVVNKYLCNEYKEVVTNTDDTYDINYYYYGIEKV